MRQPTKRTKVVILGGGYAGTLAALRLAGKTKGQPVELYLVNGQDHFVERIRHHELAAGKPPVQVPFTKLLGKRGIRFVHGWCTAIAPAAKQLSIQTTSGTETLSYDYLIYALGSTITTEHVPGLTEHAYTLADETVAGKLQAQARTLAAQKGQLLIIGGGLTGIEAATELAETYPDLCVTMATRGTLGAALSAAGTAHIQKVFTRLGIEVIENISIDHLTANAAHTSAGRVLSFDSCLWTGAFSVPKLAGASGLPVDQGGRLMVDETLRVVNHPEIYAAGDAAASRLRMACATALPMGAYVADHLAAQLTGKPAPAAFRFAYMVQCISLGRRNGLVQLVQPDDTAKPQVITGWLAARIKELICRYTLWSIHQERRWPGFHAWPQSAQPIGNPALQRSQQVRYGQSTTNL